MHKRSLSLKLYKILIVIMIVYRCSSVPADARYLLGVS